MSDPSRLEAVFLDALKRPPGARSAFLDQACAADRTLRSRIDQLLAAQPFVGEFLEGLPPTRLADDLVGASSDLAGTVIGERYKLLEPIGEGGMGEVWVADQTEPVRRLVALKLIKPGMDSKAVLARFEQERQALALMDHPNIAKVLDAGTTSGDRGQGTGDRGQGTGDRGQGTGESKTSWLTPMHNPRSPDPGRPFFVMELVKGTPITEFCDARRVSTRERLELFVLVCQAIQHAHTKGVIHRDIKPGNVLVALYDERAVPKVIDFGVAKAVNLRLTEKTLYTGFGTLVGTPAYMAPEQATFNQLDTDTRADVYALGVLLYELLTGSPPFDIDRLQRAGLEEVLRVVREEDPPRPSARLSTSRARATIAAGRQSDPGRLERLFRGELDWIVMKCLEKDRTRRYDTAAELARDVERYLRDEPVLACPPSPLYRARKVVRRHKAAVFAAGLAAFALLLATGVSGWFATQAGAAAQDAAGQAKDARDAAAREATEKEQAWRHLYVARMQTAQQAWRDGNIPRLRDLLAETRPAAGQPDLRGFEWHYLWNVGHADPPTVRHPTEVRRVLFSPDGRHFVVAGDSEQFDEAAKMSVLGPVTVYEAATGKEVRTFPAEKGYFSAIAVGPAGHRMARVVENRTIEVWDLTANKVETRLAGDGSIHSLAFSPDGKRLAVGHGASGGDSPVTVWDLAAGKVLQTMKAHGDYVYSLAFSPDGKQLASSGHDGAIKIWDPESGRLTRAIKGHARIVSEVAFSPDGTRLAGTSGPHVRVWDARTGEEVQLLSGHQGTVSTIAFSPDGKRLASGGADRAGRVWDLETGREASTFKGHGEHVFTVAFSPDGKRLVSGGRDRTVRLWDATVNPEVRLFDGSVSVAFSPDGRFLATGEGKKGIALRDAASGRERVRLDVEAHGMTFSPDGGRLVTFPGGYGSDRRARVWETGTGKLDVQLEGDAEDRVDVGAMAFSPDGRWLAASVWADNGTIQVWDAVTGRRARTIGDRPGPTGAPAFSPGGDRLAVSRDGRVTEWDAATGAELRSLAVPDGKAGVVAYSPDGEWLAAAASRPGAAGEVVVWSRATGRIAFTLRGHTHSVLSIAFSPDGRRLAASVGGYGAQIESPSIVRVWELTTGQEVLGVLGGYKSVRKVAFSPDGHRLACSGFDGVRIWDATPRAAAKDLPGK